jgi:hypothetical protein
LNHDFIKFVSFFVTLQKKSEKRGFSKKIDGKSVELFVLSNKSGFEMKVTNFGASIVKLTQILMRLP